MPLAGALQPTSHCVWMAGYLGQTQVRWEGTGNLVVSGRKTTIISQNENVCTGLQREQGGKSSITFIKKHPPSVCFLLKSVKMLRTFLLFSPVYFANSNRLQIIFFLSPCILLYLQKFHKKSSTKRQREKINIIISSHSILQFLEEYVPM